MSKYQRSEYRQHIYDWFILQLIADEPSPASMAKETGIPASTIRTWKQKYIEKFNSAEEARDYADQKLDEEEQGVRWYIANYYMNNLSLKKEKELEADLLSKGTSAEEIQEAIQRQREEIAGKVAQKLSQPWEKVQQLVEKIYEIEDEQEQLEKEAKAIQCPDTKEPLSGSSYIDSL